jgi:hypothetical protein
LPPMVALGFEPVMVGPENLAHARSFSAFA